MADYVHLHCQLQFTALTGCDTAQLSYIGSEKGKPRWSVYDDLKIIAATPEALMAETDSAISNLEYGRATALLDSSCSSSSSLPNKSSDASLTPQYQYDDRVSDEACRAGRAALAAGNLEDALDYMSSILVIFSS